MPPKTISRLKPAATKSRIRWRRAPAIGITPDFGKVPGKSYFQYDLNKAYADAVLEAEGIPFILPYAEDEKVVDEYLSRVDGVLITGGAFDIPPEEYGEVRRKGCGPLKVERTGFERALVRGALKRDMPVLGVCGGMQLLNVILGGSLYQDLPSDLPGCAPHEQKIERTLPSHAIDVKRGTRLAKAVGEGVLMVNSTHHQAVHRLGKGLIASASSPDGVVEAIEGTEHGFALGVQWHPEALFFSVPANLGLYRSFVKAAQKGAV